MEQLKTMPGGERQFLLILSLFAIVVVLAVMLNVFIAVLGDCYDQEQDKMICTYLQERASICSCFFLRPTYKFAVLRPAWSRRAPNTPQARWRTSGPVYRFCPCCRNCRTGRDRHLHRLASQ